MKNPKISVRVLASSQTELSLNASVPGVFLAAGLAKFLISADGSLSCDLVYVEPPHRRTGVATALYNYAETHFGKQIVASLKLTPDSVEYLTARGVKIDPAAEVKEYGEWMGEEDSEQEEDGD